MEFNKKNTQERCKKEKEYIEGKHMYNHGYDTSKKASLFLCQWYPLSGLVSTIGFRDTPDNMKWFLFGNIQIEV